MGQLYRTQVLLEREQHRRLRELASIEGRSMSELIREAVAEYLVEQSKEREQQGWQEALEELSRMRKEIEAEHGILPDTIFLHDRDEREDELWQRMTGEE